MNTNLKQTTGTRAIVVGGSIAGLLAARVLSEQVDELIILEKDKLANKPEPRRGVPQSTQLHSIHEKGAEILLDLFPDLIWDYEHAGVIPCDLGADMRWFLFGEWMSRVPLGVHVHWCERPRLEWEIRQRVLARPNVRIIDDCRVTGFLSDDAQQRVTGVWAKLPNGQEAEALTADYVVDAGGRGSRAPQFLEKLGYADVPESEVKIDLGYASGYFQLPDGVTPDWKALLVSAKPGLSEKLGLIYQMPNNQVKVLLAGWFGDHPPTDHEGFLAFARSLPQLDIYEQLRSATPIPPIKAYKMSSNKWNRYEQMARWPEGLFVVGDAVCSFNPSFGQGMSVAALHAMALRDAVQSLNNGLGKLRASTVGRRFQKTAARIVNNPWMITTGEDLRFEKAEGPRPFHLPIMQGYLSQVLEIAHHNPVVAKRFFDVMTFMKEPPALFHPSVSMPVVRHLIGKLLQKRPSRQATREMRPSVQPNQ